MDRSIADSVLERIARQLTEPGRQLPTTTKKDRSLIIHCDGEEISEEHLSWIVAQQAQGETIIWAVNHGGCTAEGQPGFPVRQILTEEDFLRDKPDVTQFRQVICLHLGLTQVAKAALGILDELVPYLLWEALDAEIPVYADRHGCIKSFKNGKLQKIGEQHVNTFFGFGVRDLSTLVAGEERKTAIAPDLTGERFLLTARDIMKHTEGNTIRIPAGAIVTDLAKEEAKRLNIIIRKEGSE